jgi:hypothetical protein
VIDYGTLFVSGSSLQEISRSLTQVIRTLPPELSKQLHLIRRNYMGWYGVEEGFNRLNHRTVSQIFAEYQEINVEPLASGEVEGVRYELYDAPPPDPGDSEPKPDA